MWLSCAVWLSGVLLLGCEGAAPTQILVEVDTDLSVPDQVDRFVVVATGPDGREQQASAPLSDGRLPPPRTLTLLHQGGPLTPFTVEVRAERGGTLTVARRGVLSFREGQTRVWSVRLEAACGSVACGDGETCDAGACRAESVEPDELEAWDGTPPPVDPGAGDAGSVDACQPDEICNGADDDCDGRTDEGFDLDSDPDNCGACGETCVGTNVAEASCVAGSCVIERCAEGFDDCDGVVRNGCESDLTSSAAHCGGCGQSCRPPTRSCCASSCARDC